MTSLTEQLRRDRVLWTGVVLVIAGLLLAFGGAFAVGGINAAPFPIVWEVIVRYVPGGMRTYGGVLFLLALALLHGVLPRNGGGTDDIWTHYTLSLVWGVAAGIVAALIGSWVLTGVFAWGMTLLFAAISVLAFLCWRVPPGDGPRRVA